MFGQAVLAHKGGGGGSLGNCPPGGWRGTVFPGAHGQDKGGHKGGGGYICRFHGLASSWSSSVFRAALDGHPIQMAQSAQGWSR